MVCLKTFSTVAPIFDPSRSTIQTCSPSVNEPRAITLSNVPPEVAGSSRTSTQIASISPKSLSKVSLSSILGFPMDNEFTISSEKLIAARAAGERISGRKRIIQETAQYRITQIEDYGPLYGRESV